MPNASPTDLLLDALDQAAQQHFCKLFDVLMSAPSSQSAEALQRFEAGLSKMLAMMPKVQQLVVEKAQV